MGFNNLECRKEKNIATVTVSRPKSLNALNRETLEEIIDCFEELEKDQEIAAVIITGAGEKAFIAGADISYMHEFDALEAREFGRLGHRAMDAIESFSRPVIAAGKRLCPRRRIVNWRLPVISGSRARTRNSVSRK